jgi:hypothetical protein
LENIVKKSVNECCPFSPPPLPLAFKYTPQEHKTPERGYFPVKVYFLK